MELKDIIGEFAVDFGAGRARPNEAGAYEFDIDALRVVFSEAGDGRSVLTLSAIADLPSAGRERLFEVLLGSSGTDPAAFSLKPGGSRLFLQRVDRLDGLDRARFEANLDSFLATAHRWRRLLAEYEAVLSASDGKETADDGRPEEADGFWSVRV